MLGDDSVTRQWILGIGYAVLAGTDRAGLGHGGDARKAGGAEVGNPDRTNVATGMVVKVTAEDGTTKEYAIATGETGVRAINAERIAVYPNPASGVLNISNIAVFDRIEVANITGRIIDILDVTANDLLLDIFKL